MGQVSFQILSDLHLETRSPYGSFRFSQTAPHLALLGDIGHVANDELFSFLEDQLGRYSVVFFLLGNHDPYHLSFKVAKTKMRSFETSMNKRSLMGKFVFLDQTRHDLTKDLTVLGGTLFSQISFQQESVVESRMVDFKDIVRWNVDEHNAAHESDIQWVNPQVSAIARDEPQRQIAIFTHHSPSVDPRSTDPKHSGSDVSTASSTELSGEECCNNPSVVAWAFGHTHFNCTFTDTDGKAIISKPKGLSIDSCKTLQCGKGIYYWKIVG